MKRVGFEPTRRYYLDWVTASCLIHLATSSKAGAEGFEPSSYRLTAGSLTIRRHSNKLISDATVYNFCNCGCDTYMRRKIGNGCRSRTYIVQGQSLAHSPVMITRYIKSEPYESLRGALTALVVRLIGRARRTRTSIALGFNQPLYFGAIARNWFRL